MIEFAELCAKSNFSFLHGASRPEEMVRAACEKGICALAIADRNGLYGSVRAHTEAKKASQRYIIGAELLVAADARERPVVLLAQNHAGYRNLCRLLTRAHADRPREQALLSPGDLGVHAEGLFLILPAPAHAEELFSHDVQLGLQKEAFDKRAFLATHRQFAPQDRPRESLAKMLSHRFGLPMIATARPVFHHSERKPVADVLRCIRQKMTLDQAGDSLSLNAEAYLHSPAQMARLFSDAPERLSRTVEIAEACKFSFADIRYSFPCGELAPGETPDALLARLADLGARLRYPQGVPPAVARQVERELCLIAKLGVAQFFFPSTKS